MNWQMQGTSSQPYTSVPTVSTAVSIPPGSNQAAFVQSPVEMEQMQASPAWRASHLPYHPAPTGRGTAFREHEALLLSFIYDYCYKTGMRSVAAALLREAPDIQVRPLETKEPVRTSSVGSVAAPKQGSSPAHENGAGQRAGIDEDVNDGMQSNSPAKAVEAGSVATSVDSIFDKSGSRTSTSPPSSTYSPPTNSTTLPEPGVPIDVEGGFLSEWWGMFWDVYRASSGKPASRAAQLYVEDERQLKTHQMAMRNQSMVPTVPMRQNGMAALAPNVVMAQQPMATAGAIRLAQQHPAQMSQQTHIRLANGQIVPASSPQSRLAQQHQAEAIQRQAEEQARQSRAQESQAYRQQAHMAQAAQAAQAAQMQGQQTTRAVTPANAPVAKRGPARQLTNPTQQRKQTQAGQAMPQYPATSPRPDQATVDAHKAKASEAERHYRAGLAAQQQKQSANGGPQMIQLPPNMTQAHQIQQYLHTQGAQQMQPAPLTPRTEHPLPLPPASGQSSMPNGQPSNYVSSPGPIYTSAPTPKNPPPSSTRPMKRAGASEASSEPATKRRAPSEATGSPARNRVASRPDEGPSRASEGQQATGAGEEYNHFDFAALLGGSVPVHTEPNAGEHHADANMFDIDQYLDFGTTA